MDFLTAVSAAAFLFYGLACLVSPKLVAEFERYRLARFRALVGSLEVAGALGAHRGVVVPATANRHSRRTRRTHALRPLGALAHRDPWYAMLPALVLGMINLFIALRTAEDWIGR